MSGLNGWIRATVIVGGALTVTACTTYPREPRYPVRPTDVISHPTNVQTGPVVSGGGMGATTSQPQNPYYTGQPATPTVTTPPVEQGVRAPSGRVEGGALPPAGGTNSVAPAPAPVPTNPPATPSLMPGASYEIQPGDTISGVGRRFQTPVQTLIQLNNLGPSAAIRVGQKIVLPDSAVDRGVDPYATGASPVGVRVPENGVTPPPPPPPSGNAPLPQAPRTPAPAPAPVPVSPSQPAPARTSAAAPASSSLALQWPVRGDIVRRFGPVGMGERNNGINIGASAGTEVKAAADGRVAYVGDDIVGQGLTVLIVHRDGWRTVYGHLGSASVRDGADVRAGQSIGTVGLTAGDGRPSIHFETRQMRGDDPVAIDPLTVLPR